MREFQVGDIVELVHATALDEKIFLTRVKKSQPYRVRRILVSDEYCRYDFFGSSTYVQSVPPSYIRSSRYVFAVGDSVLFKLKPIAPYAVGIIDHYNKERRKYCVVHKGKKYFRRPSCLTLKHK